jgi:hypothetical protein
MRSSRLLVLLTLAGGVVCLLVLLLTGKGRERAPAVSAAPPGGAAASGAGAAELEGLRAALDALAARVERLELAPASAGEAAPERAPAPALSQEELERLRALAAALGAAEAGVGDGDGGAAAASFEELVVGLIEDHEQRRQEERAEARRAAAAERVERRVAELAEALGLSSFQSAEMLSLLTAEELGRQALFEELRDTGVLDRDASRARMKELRDATLVAAAQILTPDQYKGYVASRPDGFLVNSDRNPGPPAPGGGGR